jgi:hypothetical protein
MTLEALLDALYNADIQTQDTVIYHFRIATSGGISPENCHPFPISAKEEDLKSLTLSCKAAFVHNGILGKGSGELSDTQLYILNTLSRYGNLKKKLPRIARDTVGSRTAILQADGQLWLTGTWIEEDGYHFSNKTFIDLGWGYGDFEWDMPDTCVCCHSGLPLVERDGTLLCELCGTSYAPCQACGAWQPISELEARNDEEGSAAFLCSFCAEEDLDEIVDCFDWWDERGRFPTERLLRDWP